jgi:hypothetical protein
LNLAVKPCGTPMPEALRFQLIIALFGLPE